jgi:hypothetical protein
MTNIEMEILEKMINFPFVFYIGFDHIRMYTCIHTYGEHLPYVYHIRMYTYANLTQIFLQINFFEFEVNTFNKLRHFCEFSR